jgi:DNA primase
MAKISEQSIEQIRNRADIIDIISSYVELKKRGRNFFGLCPFHSEKTASFSVSPEKQIYKCFGCGAGGSSIDFIMEIEKLDFIESIRYLADQYGVEIEETHTISNGQDVTANIFEMNNQTLSLYQENLFDQNNTLILTHLTNRGLNIETIKTFGLGLSYTGKDEVLKKMQGKYNSKSMLSSGLFVDTKFGYMDRFRNRIMFSLYNITGRVIGFAGRAIDKNENAKYINSPQTQVYNKSKVLYGLHLTKNDISKSDSAIIVEGYIDFLQLYQSGVKNIVAVSGTAFTDGHAHLLKRLTKNVLIAYDGDSAGVSSAVKAGFVLLKNGMNPSIIRIPDGLDPDDWVLKSGVDPFNESAKNAVPLIEFSHQEFQKKTNTNIADFINETLPELLQIQDNVVAEINLKSLSSCTGISFESIKNNYLSLVERKDRRDKYQTVEHKSSSKKLSIENDLLMLCFSKDREIREQIYNNLNIEWMKSDQSKRIYEQIYIHLNSEFEPDPTIILDQLELKEDHHRLASLSFEVDRIAPSISMAKNCIQRLEHMFLKEKLEKYREMLKDTEKSFKDNSELITRITEIQYKMNSIKGAQS